MEKVQTLRDYFKHNILAFQITGIWMNPMDLTGTSWLIVVYSLAVNLLFIMSPQICHVIYMYKARNNVQAFAEEFHVSLPSLLVVFKSYSLLKNFGIIENLLNTMDMDMFQAKNDYQMKQMKKVMGKWKKTYWLYASNAMSFVFFMLLSSLLERILNGTKVLPLVDCYPFDVHPSPTYEFIYIYQSFVICWLVIQNFNLDTFITGLITVAAVQCDILSNDLENLIPERMRCEENQIICVMDKKLVECIKHHKEIHRFISDVAHCFSFNIFQQFSCSVITFCTSMFEFSMTEPLSQEFYVIIIYQCSVFFQLFIFCWAGTELTEKSKKIPLSAYQSDWVNASKSFRSSLLIFMQNAQKPFTIMALLFPVCVDMFLQIVRSSFSYYTVLISLSEE
nr:odorant receptor [Semanotus bifasciatus]